MGLPFSAIVKYVMGGFNPLSWFAKGEPGAWYDPSDLTTLFQDSAGATPVTAVEQPVGLMLDKSRGLALGAELVTNGGPFTNTTGWVSRANCTLAVVGNELIGTGTTSGSVYRFYYQPVTVIGYTYKVTVNITSLAGTGDLLTVYSSAGAGQIASISIPTTGIYTIYFTATTTTTCVEFGDINSTSPKYTGISNISVKQIAGNHAFQGDSTSTPAKRPMLSARVNLLTKTEDFSDAVWVKSGSATTSSSNTLNLSTVNSYIYQLNVAPAGVQLTLSATLSGTGTVSLVTYDNVSSFQFNSITLTSTPTQYFFPVTLGSGATDRRVGIGRFNTDTATSVTVDRFDVRPTNSGALLPPYQRVNTASDYDTVGFPLYLKANGTSSAMSTNSIDFTGTDKMTVVTGVRWIDISSMLFELSANSDVVPGTFYKYFDPTNGTPRVSIRGNIGVCVFDFNPKVQKLTTNVFSQNINLSSSNVVGRLNGVTNTMTQTGTTTAGNFTTQILYLFARGSTSLFLNGQFYGAIIRGAQSDTASVTQTENYMAQKTGITF